MFPKFADAWPSIAGSALVVCCHQCCRGSSCHQIFGFGIRHCVWKPQQETWKKYSSVVYLCSDDQPRWSWHGMRNSQQQMGYRFTTPKCSNAWRNAIFQISQSFLLSWFQVVQTSSTNRPPGFLCPVTGSSQSLLWQLSLGTWQLSWPWKKLYFPSIVWKIWQQGLTTRLDWPAEPQVTTSLTYVRRQQFAKELRLWLASFEMFLIILCWGVLKSTKRKHWSGEAKPQHCAALWTFRLVRWSLFAVSVVPACWKWRVQNIVGKQHQCEPRKHILRWHGKLSEGFAKSKDWEICQTLGRGLFEGHDNDRRFLWPGCCSWKILQVQLRDGNPERVSVFGKV